MNVSIKNSGGGKLLELLRRLRDRTRAGEVGWEGTPEPGTYLATFAGTSVEIGHRPAGEGGGDVPVLGIYNRGGDLVEAVEASDFDGFDAREAAEALAAIYAGARERAFSVERHLDTLLLQLAEPAVR